MGMPSYIISHISAARSFHRRLMDVSRATFDLDIKKTRKAAWTSWYTTVTSILNQVNMRESTREHTAHPLHPGYRQRCNY
jgi:hypothetical protein